MSEKEERSRSRDSLLSRLCCGMCCCFGWCCSGYECCCCVRNRNTEKHPLLSAKDADGLGINGRPVPTDQELQQMEYKFSTSTSPSSTPWGSEARSEASEPPDDDIDVEPIEEQPRARSKEREQQEDNRETKATSSTEHSLSWKLLSSEMASMPQSQFTIQIRKKTTD